MLPSEKAQAKKIIDSMMEEDSDSDEEEEDRREKKEEEEEEEEQKEGEVLGKKQDGDKSLKSDVMKEVSHALKIVDKLHECHSSPHETPSFLSLSLTYTLPLHFPPSLPGFKGSIFIRSRCIEGRGAIPTSM